MKNKKPWEIAEEILNKYNLRGPPFDPSELAKKLDLIVIEMNMDDDVSGMIVTQEKSSVVCINQKHSIVRKRFTLAHEIGHLCLGHQMQEDGNVHVDKGRMDYKPVVNLRADGNDGSQETTANKFAASILMPKDDVKREIDKFGVVDLEDKHLEELALRFNVSVQAMSIRLSNLNNL